MDRKREREAAVVSNAIRKAWGAEKEQKTKLFAKTDEKTTEKKRFRAIALEKRDRLTDEERRDYSDRIIKKLTGQSCYREADAVLTYVGFRSEVDTFPLIKQAFADGKAVFAPKVLGKEMDFYRIFSVDDLTAGYRGILEPAGGQLFENWENDQMSQFALICLPGAAFDRACHRIGYGGGFYDRYLSRLQQGRERITGKAYLQAETDAAANPRAGTDVSCPQMNYFTAGLAYNCQIFDKIPWETHDIRPQRIITETEIIAW